MDNALALGELPSTLPFVKKKGIELLKANYTSQKEAAKGRLRRGIRIIERAKVHHNR